MDCVGQKEKGARLGLLCSLDMHLPDTCIILSVVTTVQAMRAGAHQPRGLSRFRNPVVISRLELPAVCKCNDLDSRSAASLYYAIAYGR